jgi:hypothetical protein
MQRMSRPDDVLEEGLKLDPPERADVAAGLLESLDAEPGTSPEQVEVAWALEIERRARRVLTGNSDGRLWSEVRSEIETKISRR